VKKLVLLIAALLAAACATTKQPAVDQNEPRRVVGTDNDVRIDAELYGDQLGPSISLPIKYDITNNRQSPIAIAELVPEVNYDEETRTVTVSIGSEVPGATLVPRLIMIKPGEKKNFSGIARVNIMLPSGTPVYRIPRQLRFKVNFLDDVSQFEKLISMTQKGVYDPKLADELFPTWLERNQTVYTNALPMHWTLPPWEVTLDRSWSPWRWKRRPRRSTT